MSRRLNPDDLKARRQWAKDYQDNYMNGAEARAILYMFMHADDLEDELAALRAQLAERDARIEEMEAVNRRYRKALEQVVEELSRVIGHRYDKCMAAITTARKALADSPPSASVEAAEKVVNLAGAFRDACTFPGKVTTRHLFDAVDALRAAREAEKGESNAR